MRALIWDMYKRRVEAPRSWGRQLVRLVRDCFRSNSDPRRWQEFWIRWLVGIHIVVCLPTLFFHRFPSSMRGTGRKSNPVWAYADLTMEKTKYTFSPSSLRGSYRISLLISCDIMVSRIPWSSSSDSPPSPSWLRSASRGSALPVPEDDSAYHIQVWAWGKEIYREVAEMDKPLYSLRSLWASPLLSVYSTESYHLWSHFLLSPPSRHRLFQAHQCQGHHSYHPLTYPPRPSWILSLSLSLHLFDFHRS